MKNLRKITNEPAIICGDTYKGNIFASVISEDDFGYAWRMKKGSYIS